MNKKTVQTLTDVLGCRTEQVLRICYPFAKETLLNWKRGKLHKTTEILLKIIVAQHKHLNEEQRQEVIETMLDSR